MLPVIFKKKKEKKRLKNMIKQNIYNNEKKINIRFLDVFNKLKTRMHRETFCANNNKYNNKKYNNPYQMININIRIISTYFKYSQ